MFVQRIVLLLVVALAFVALWGAGATRSAGPETRYVVQPGDTLWVIAAERYAGDPREAIWHIKRRNGLQSSGLTPGSVLTLP